MTRSHAVTRILTVLSAAPFGSHEVIGHVTI